MQRSYAACMTTIQVRHVPPETHAVLRRRAAERGMSMQE
jgi:plasmid stability protein